MKSNIVFVIILLVMSLLFSRDINGQGKAKDIKDLHTFNIYFINGYGISYDFYKELNSTFRIHLDFNGYGNDSESSRQQKYYYSNNLEQENQSDAESSNNSFTILFSPQYVYRFYKSDLGELYFGAGLYFEYKNSSFESESKREEQHNVNELQYYYRTFNTDNAKTYSFGGILLLGLKGRLNEYISLFAETHFSGSKFWDESEYTNTNEQSDYNSKNNSTAETNGWNYKTIFIKGGISISL